jgi:hypothetical protein
MRSRLFIIVTTLLLGCQSHYVSRGDVEGLVASYERQVAARIGNALERRVTVEEARHVVFDEIDRAIQTVQTRSASKAEGRAELEILTRERKRRSAKFDTFLSRSRSGDELWLYRTSVTADQRGGESGLAFVRDGAVVEHMGVMILD